MYDVRKATQLFSLSDIDTFIWEISFSECFVEYVYIVELFAELSACSMRLDSTDALASSTARELYFYTEQQW